MCVCTCAHVCVHVDVCVCIHGRVDVGQETGYERGERGLGASEENLRLIHCRCETFQRNPTEIFYTLPIKVSSASLFGFGSWTWG